MKISNSIIEYLTIQDLKLIPIKKKSLDTDEIIIYTIYLPDFIDLKSDLSQFLTSKELKKAQRFFKELDRNRFIIYRSILKFILAAHTKLNVKNIYLDYHFNKKPYLASHPWLYFNVSHSEDYAAIAVSRKNVGLDIEYMSRDFNFTSLLPDVFDDNQVLEIQNAVDKKHAFYTSWTRKEAFVKALGKGIDEDFKYIPSLDGQHSIDFHLTKNSKNWQVYSFNLTDHYLGAVAAEALSTIPRKILLYTVPNNMENLLDMIKVKK
ncbi:4'-phosphopantetheinyl transferase superfamily protein [Flavobacterium sp. ACN6]|uniref:4'-phosphopantetheinyl transferase family protein n=1 Tax=Flavobacterium sp. ACN6 TaxID=1920426 RepID=UPI00155491CF|nr:4'-phosphopantetheinyl transferase superfamily protein [Flavobacterium sp. ACN6]PBJ08948.1 4'-phosphopantetheinyl transferase psf-1 [Flavobacterium sp. ACN6]